MPPAAFIACVKTLFPQECLGRPGRRRPSRHFGETSPAFRTACRKGLSSSCRAIWPYRPSWPFKSVWLRGLQFATCHTAVFDILLTYYGGIPYILRRHLTWKESRRSRSALFSQAVCKPHNSLLTTQVLKISCFRCRETLACFHTWLRSLNTCSARPIRLPSSATLPSADSKLPR